MADIVSTTGAPLSYVEQGRHVILKGDPNSPAMTALVPVLDEKTHRILGFVCGWFKPDLSFQSVQFPIQCLEVVQ